MSHFKLKPLAFCLSTAMLSLYASAQTVQLKAVEVVEKVDPASHQVVPNRYNEPQSIKQLLKEETGVSVIDAQRSRMSSGNVKIRGLSGNNVGMSIDGIPLPEGQESTSSRFSTLGQTFGRGMFVETAGLRSAQIEKTGSSKGIAGNVDFRTLSAADLLKEKAVGGFANSAYHSADKSFAQTLAVAAQSDRWDALVLGTFRKGHETETHGEIETPIFGTAVRGVQPELQARTKAEPEDNQSRYLLSKIGFKANENHRFELAFEALQRKREIEPLATQGGQFIYGYRPLPSAAVTGMLRAMGITNVASNLTFYSGLYATQQQGQNTDKAKRYRGSLSHSYHSNEGFVQKATTTLYAQSARTDNQTYRAGVDSTSVAQSLTNSSTTKDRAFGLNSDLISPINDNLVLRYGLSYAQHRLTNQLTTSSRGNQSPNPNAKVQYAQGYLESEFAVGDLLITPHLGVANYRYRPDLANGYVQAGSSQIEVKARNETKVLPQLRLEWRIVPEFKPYAKYSTGVKMPSAQQLALSYEGTRGYAAVGNPNLKPQTSQNVEAGFTGQAGGFQYQLAGYYNRYKDFLASTSTTTAEYPVGLFSWENRDKVRVYGVEFKSSYAFNDAFRVYGSIDYNMMEENSQDRIERQPLTYKAGAAYETDFWGLSSDLSYTQKRLNKTIAGESRFTTLVDVGAYVRPIKNLTISASVNNLFNQKYWNWEDVYNQNLTQINADAYSAPGRNFNLGLRYEF